MFIAELQTSGLISRLQDLRSDADTLSRFFALQALLLTTALYVGTFPYMITKGSVRDSMWFPIYWLAPWLWLTLGAAALMLSLLTLTEFQNVLSTRYTHFLGRMSFAIYLLHYMVLVLCDIVIMPVLGPATNTNGGEDRTVAAVIVFLLVIVPAVLASSYVFTVYVDEVAIECSKDFYTFWLTCFPSCCKCLKQQDKSVQNDYYLHTALNASSSAAGDVECDASPPRVEAVDVVSSCEGSGQDDTTPPQCAVRCWQGVDWSGKKMLLLYFSVLVFVPCCVPSHQTSTCYLQDDDW